MTDHRSILFLTILLFCTATAKAAEGGIPGSGVPGNLGRGASTAGVDAGRFLTSPSRLDRRGAIVLSGIATAGGIIYAFDREILEGFERSKGNNFYDFIVDTGEWAGDAGHSGKTFPFYLGGLAAGYMAGYEPLTTISAELLEYQLIPGLFRNLMKGIIGRTRPEENRDPRFFQFGGGHSTPSGHAANIFALATILSHRIDFLPLTVAGYSLATCVSLQRVDGEAHWPSDIFLGAVYGVASSRLLLKLHDEKGVRLEPLSIPDRGFIGVGVRCALQ